jgi:hypothetical protein
VLSTEEQELLDFESSDIADYDRQESIDGEHADAAFAQSKPYAGDRSPTPPKEDR